VRRIWPTSRLASSLTRTQAPRLTRAPQIQQNPIRWQQQNNRRKLKGSSIAQEAFSFVPCRVSFQITNFQGVSSWMKLSKWMSRIDDKSSKKIWIIHQGHNFNFLIWRKLSSGAPSSIPALDVWKAPKTLLKPLNLESFPSLLVVEIQPTHRFVVELLKQVFRSVVKSQASRKTARGRRIEKIEG